MTCLPSNNYINQPDYVHTLRSNFVDRFAHVKVALRELSYGYV